VRKRLLVIAFLLASAYAWHCSAANLGDFRRAQESLASAELLLLGGPTDDETDEIETAWDYAAPIMGRLTSAQRATLAGMFPMATRLGCASHPAICK